MAVATTLVTPERERQYQAEGYFVIEEFFTIEEVERLTQLSFTGGPAGAPKPLSSFDPLKAAPAKRRARRPAVHEAASVDSDVPEAYVPLGSLEDIQR